MSTKNKLLKKFEMLQEEKNIIKKNLIYLLFSGLSFIVNIFLLFVPITYVKIQEGTLYSQYKITAISWLNKANTTPVTESYLILQIVLFVFIFFMIIMGIFNISKALSRLKNDKEIESLTKTYNITCVLITIIYTLFTWIFPVINASFGAPTFSKITLFPIIYIIIITVLSSLYKSGLSLASNQKEETLAQTKEGKEINDISSLLKASRIELFIYTLVSIAITIVSILSNIIKITYTVESTSKVVSVFNIKGFDLIFDTSNITSNGQRVIAFIVFIFFVLSLLSAFTIILSFIKKSKVYYQIALGSIISSVSTCLLIGLFGQYYKIVQGMNLDYIKELLKGLVNNLDQIINFKIQSVSLIYFLISCSVLLLIFIRKPYTRSLQLEQRLEFEKNNLFPKSIKITDGGLTGTSNNSINTNDCCPTFTELDNKFVEMQLELESKEETLFDSLTLQKLVDFIVTYARDSRLHLYYTHEDIATFIAGLGTSKLSILQGMSGTGKTSLPKIVAEALNSVCDIIEVESSWRDKNELLGYYNEFNKVYTPKKFTQALYKAKLNSEVLTFIVLDEMNLSRIEYYFSDFLSIMENEEDKRKIKLVNIKLNKNNEQNEYYGLTEGHTLKIPNNVWFIGTANRDESTFDISDKVYDRANTINFDKRAKKIHSYGEEKEPKFVPAQALNNLFTKAKQEVAFTIDDNEIINKVEKLLEPYNISFGNRIAKQIEDFVKIYASCFTINEQTIFDALEIILLSKVVRKLELKNIEDKEELAQEFLNLNLKRCSNFILSLKED